MTSTVKRTVRPPLLTVPPGVLAPKVRFVLVQKTAACAAGGLLLVVGLNLWKMPKLLDGGAVTAAGITRPAEAPATGLLRKLQQLDDEHELANAGTLSAALGRGVSREFAASLAFGRAKSDLGQHGIALRSLERAREHAASVEEHLVVLSDLGEASARSGDPMMSISFLHEALEVVHSPEAADLPVGLRDDLAEELHRRVILAKMSATWAEAEQQGAEVGTGASAEEPEDALELPPAEGPERDAAAAAPGAQALRGGPGAGEPPRPAELQDLVSDLVTSQEPKKAGAAAVAASVM